jgi:hypothetical protein
MIWNKAKIIGFQEEYINFEKTISFGTIAPHRKQLKIYYRDSFNCDPIFMVTMLTNSLCYGQIVSSNDFLEAVNVYLEEADINNEDKESEIEVISTNSFYL